jgi:phosphatidylglycerophosphate synthase
LSTASGKRLDEVADKSLVTGVVLVLFADGILRFSIDSVMFWVVVVIIARDLIVTAIRTFWQEEAKKIPSLFLAKIKTFALMPAIGLLLYSGGGYMFHLHAVWLGFALLWIALIAALISGIQYSILFFRGR